MTVIHITCISSACQGILTAIARRMSCPPEADGRDY